MPVKHGFNQTNIALISVEKLLLFQLKWVIYRGATSSSFRGEQFSWTLFDDIIVFIQPWYNFFA